MLICHKKKDSQLIPLNYKLCKEYKIDYMITSNINSKETANILKDNDIYLACICSLHQIIKPGIFSIPKDGMINLHPSYLPYYQGPNPWYWMIKNGEKEFGASIHFITEEIDKGTIISREKISLENCIDGNIIFNSVSILASKMLINVLKYYITNGNIKIDTNVSENELDKGFYNFKPKFEDFRLNLEDERPNENYKFINRIIRWASPWFIYNKKIVHVKRAIRANEDCPYDFKITQTGDSIKVYNKYGVLDLQII